MPEKAKQSSAGEGEADSQNNQTSSLSGVGDIGISNLSCYTKG